MPSLLDTAIDHAINRLSGTYAGFEPRRPGSLVIPGFVRIEEQIPSLLDVVAEHIDLARLKRPLVISDEVTWDIAGRELFEALEGARKRPIQSLVRSNDYAQAAAVLEVATKKPRLYTKAEHPWERRAIGPKIPSLVFGVGGGTVMDLAKLVAFQLHVPCITVPTSLANDGIASPFAVIRPDAPGNVTVRANTPLGVLIDLGRLKPCSEEAGSFYARMMRSGIGDAVSNLTSTLDWRLAAEQGREQLDYLAHLHARSAGEVVLHRLEAGVGLCDDDLVLTLAAGLVSSGEAMARVGSSRPASGFEHKLYHAYHNRLRFPSRATHGVLVAVGALISARAHGQWFEEMHQGFAQAGLPVCGADLDEWELSLERLEQAIHASVEVKPERYTILEHLGAEAMVEVARQIYG